MPGAKFGLVDYIARHPYQKAKKVSAYDDKFIGAKLKLISTSVNSLKLETIKPAVQFNKLLQAHDPVKSHLNLRHITPKIEATIKAINLISTHAKHVHTHNSHLSLAQQNHTTINSNILNDLKYAYPASQIPLKTSPAEQNRTHCEQFFQNRN